MPEQPHRTDRLRDDIDLEIALARAGADPAGDDEPEAEPYLTRLLSLRDAVAAGDTEEG
ncbi:hypothetical protein [Nocardioides sp. CER19]|uniref:hypothetical protein n=1 Tax=Nocardioides sp. CER19 TaxID=3038538 RepID=UPI00244BD649|nr:hypothetical protein [Nocardioides sp. CER19]MDH2414429.1 hypothetical protein [Nocardioides sp. CER19]